MMTLILVIAIVAVVVYLFVTKDTPHNDIDDWKDENYYKGKSKWEKWKYYKGWNNHD